ncbi:MAG: phosphoheptose isomerase [Opitutaceae bacterium]|nr:phosphoheptose isomerase [Opitutaceae bacterium]
MTDLPQLLPIVPTRVRRGYRGGSRLDALAGHTLPVDADRPEDWLASTVEARNPGLAPEPLEGLTRVRLPSGEVALLRDLLLENSNLYLGAGYKTSDTCLTFIAKLLDAANRLHVQAHPTSEFARARLGAPYGKLEVYYVLEVRPGCEGYLRLGFQRPPSREEWRRIILQQDIAAMDACFDPIPVKPGEVWIVPGGVPHAIGGGVLLVEVMEPSDLVVRCEFERDGVVVPPNGRFMGQDIELCLDLFDCTPYPIGDATARFKLTPGRPSPDNGLEPLVGRDRTSCFELFRLRTPPGETTLPLLGRPSLLIQTVGATELHNGTQRVALPRGAACFVASASPPLTIGNNTRSELLVVQPVSTLQ